MNMGKFTGLVIHQKKPLRWVLKLIFMNLDHNKFTKNTCEHTMQINHDEELDPFFQILLLFQTSLLSGM